MTIFSPKEVSVSQGMSQLSIQSGLVRLWSQNKLTRSETRSLTGAGLFVGFAAPERRGQQGKSGNGKPPSQ
jgi:hypothetical protein